MTTLFVVDEHSDGIAIFSKLDTGEAAIVGDVHLVVRPGEEALGLPYEQWADIAHTTGRIKSAALPDND